MIKTKLSLCLSSIITFVPWVAHAGFYAGLGLGSDAINFKQYSNTFKAAPAPFNVINKTNLSGMGVMGSVFGGYEYLYRQVYFAIEANGKTSSSTFKTSNSEYVNHKVSSSKYKINQPVAMSFFSGYLIIPTTLFYGRIGYSNAKMTVNTTDSSLENISSRRGGTQAGFGIKQEFTRNVSMRIDFSYGWYNKISLHSFDPVSSVSKNTQISPEQQLIEFAVVRRFG